jgi:hypothetical protein
MKKLLLLLFFSIFCYSQSDKPIFAKELKNCEIDGHISKDIFYYTSYLDRIEIKDCKGCFFQVKKCKEKECQTIHLIEINISKRFLDQIILTPN